LAADGGGGGATGLTIAAGGTDGWGAACFGGGGGACGGANRAGGTCGCSDAGLAIPGEAGEDESGTGFAGADGGGSFAVGVCDRGCAPPPDGTDGLMRLVSVDCDSGVIAAEGVEGLAPGACDGVPDFPPAAAGGIGSAWIPFGLAGAGVPGATAAEGAAGAAGPVAGTCGDDVPGFGLLLGGAVPGVTAVDGVDDRGIAFGAGSGCPLSPGNGCPGLPGGWFAL